MTQDQLVARVDELETRLAFQDDTIQTLNDVLVEQQRLVERLQLQLSALTLSKDGQWLLRLQDGVKIYNSQQQAAQRLIRFAKLYKKLRKAHKATITRVDLRYPNALAVN